MRASFWGRRKAYTSGIYTPDITLCYTLVGDNVAVSMPSQQNPLCGQTACLLSLGMTSLPYANFQTTP